ncbi:MAG: hypothetical protein KF877_02190 [Bacteroidetes bacterium]|nr:hypothetical protein [Bacteroidota bacterium]
MVRLLGYGMEQYCMLLQGCKLCNLYISAKFIGLGKAYGLRNEIVRWVSWNGEKALLLLAN